MMSSLITSYHKFLFLAVVAFVCCLVSSNVADVRAQDFEIPQPTGNAVNDFAGVMDAGSKQTLENTLINLKKQQQIEFAVVTVKTTGGRDIFDYALAIARKWGIGPANDEKQGLLLLVAIDDRKYQTLVSRHLQGELTDGVVGSLQRQYLISAFRAGKYGEGLNDTIRAYIDTLASERGFSTEGIYQQEEKTTRPPPPPRRTKSGGGFSICGAFVVILIVIIFLLAGRGRGSGGGCLNALFLGSLLSNLTQGGSSGGWSSGGFGGSSGDSGGGFGGFGGGGDFDGGGAGGSW